MKTKPIRWKGLIPLVLLLGLIVAVWILLLDTLVERGVEEAGAMVVGARVDLDAADVRVSRGSVRLSGLQVTDPGSPMRNLFEAREIVAAISPGPLLQKKLVVDSVLVRGVRFGTARTESGALPNAGSSSGLIFKRVNDWASQIRFPSMNLQGLGAQVINIPAISPDSLRTVAQARAIVGSADSLRQAWETRISAADPRPQVDSARAMLERLTAADFRALGVAGTRDLVNEARSTIGGLNNTLAQIKGLEQGVTQGVAAVKADVTALDDARQADYAYARGLVNLPSLDAPDISPALFGQIGLERLKPLLYWLEIAEKYMPPGLDPRARTGPVRTRASGITVDYPRENTYPRFLLRFADVDLSLEGDNAATGAYRAQVAGLTTEPALYGRPMQLVAQRSGGRVGPRTVRVFAQLDHARQPIRDSAVASIGGLTLPTIPLAPLGARVALGDGTTELTLSRHGGTFEGRWYVRTTRATWEKIAVDSAAGGAARDQARRAVEDLLWRTVSGIRDVEIEARISGSIEKPAVTVRSNIATAIAQSLRKAVGEEVARAERLVRARVDSLVGEGRRQVDERVAGLQGQLQDRVARQREQLEGVKADLEAKLKEKLSTLPGGIQLPGGVRLPR